MIYTWAFIGGYFACAILNFLGIMEFHAHIFYAAIGFPIDFLIRLSKLMKRVETWLDALDATTELARKEIDKNVEIKDVVKTYQKENGTGDGSAY